MTRYSLLILGVSAVLAMASASAARPAADALTPDADAEVPSSASECYEGFWLCPDDGTLWSWAVGICRQVCGVPDGISGAQFKCNAHCDAQCVDGGERVCSF